MNFYSLILVVCAIGVQCSLSADDDTFHNREATDTDIQAAEQAIADLVDSNDIEKRSPGRLNPSVRYAGFGKREDAYSRWVRGNGRRPLGSVYTNFGKRKDEKSAAAKRRKFGVPSSRLAYFGKREDEMENEEAAPKIETAIKEGVIERIFGVFDLNGDGLIDKDEFVAVMEFVY